MRVGWRAFAELGGILAKVQVRTAADVGEVTWVVGLPTVFSSSPGSVSETLNPNYGDSCVSKACSNSTQLGILFGS